MNPQPTYKNDQWHLTKGVPITIIVTLLVQTAGVVWWASAMSTNVGQVQKDIDRVNVQIKEATANRTTMDSRLIRVEEKLSTQTDLLRRILVKVDGSEFSPSRK